MFRTVFILILCHLSVDLFTGIWPLFKKIGGIDIAVASMIGMTGGVLGNVLQLIFGQISDKGKRKQYIIMGLFLSAAASLYPYVNSYYWYFFLLSLTFIGSSAFHPAATGLTGRIAKEKKSMMIALFVAGGGIGLAFSQVAFSFVYYHFNQQTGLLLILPFLCIILCSLFLPANLEASSNSQSTVRFIPELKNVFFSLKNLYLLEVLNAAMTIGFVFLIPELMEKLQLGDQMAKGGGHLLFVMGTVLMIVVTSKLSDKFGHKKLLIGSFLVLFPLYYVFLNVPQLPIEFKIILFFLIGGLMGICNPVGVSLGHYLMPKNASLVSALLMGAAWAAGNLILPFVGFVTKAKDPIFALNILGSLIIVSILICFSLPSKAKVSQTYDEKTKDFDYEN